MPLKRSIALLLLLAMFGCLALPAAGQAVPAPLLKTGQAVNWWFVFKFNAGAFPGCGGSAQRACTFGGTVQKYDQFGQQYIYASSAAPALQAGGGCAGDTADDPVGATFSQVYNGKFFYLLWNDQFDGDPVKTEAEPWGHSKGMLVWNADGNGFVMQVSTPSWPGSGSSGNPRQTDGNTLGCVKDNDVLVSQHFFALALTKADTVAVLKGLANASVVTDPTKPQLVNNGGPPDVQAAVKALGKLSDGKTATAAKLSSGVILLSKPNGLAVPPWQMVSAMLGGEPLRAATWWADPEIASTDSSAKVGCWDPSLGTPGAVDIAVTGTWAEKTLGFKGTADPEGNHAKIGVSTGSHTYAIFGDMNQQGSLSGPNCKSSQNGRGGLFYVVDNAQLFGSLQALLKGDSAPQ
jgi:hypothetical protein